MIEVPRDARGAVGIFADVANRRLGVIALTGPRVGLGSRAHVKRRRFWLDLERARARGKVDGPPTRYLRFGVFDQIQERIAEAVETRTDHFLGDGERLAAIDDVPPASFGWDRQTICEYVKLGDLGFWFCGWHRVCSSRGIRLGTGSPLSQERSPRSRSRSGYP